MDPRMFDELAKFGAIALVIMSTLAVFGIWKLIEIVVWLFTHVRIDWV